ncbi:MAG: hypothetical protein IJ242_13405 [Clostridia bacterium]|nr:hypothetical protein [Clostridia bacterium]
MSTRASVIFCRGDVDKELYNHFDGYPDGLGRDVIRLVKTVNLEQLYDHLIPVDGNEAMNFDIWHCEQAAAGKDYPYRRMDGWFIKDSIMCEYAYRIDLDHRRLEFYTGFQMTPQQGNRYGEDYEEARDGTKYYPCGLRGIFTFEFIKETETELVIDELNRLSEDRSDAPELFGKQMPGDGMQKISRKLFVELLKDPARLFAFGDPVLVEEKKGGTAVCMSRELYGKLKERAAMENA